MNKILLPLSRFLMLGATSVVAATPLLGSAPAGGLAFSPSTIDNAYVGALDLTITGLDSNGQSVILEEYFDRDLSGAINAGDKLLRQFVVTDGQAATIAGVRNLNIPGDEDGVADAAIHTRLLYSAGELLGKIDGPHIFRVSPSGSGFTPFTASLAVAQHDYAGSGISGMVTSGVAAPYALVALLSAVGDHEFVAVTVADASGNYSLKAAPGNYQILAAKGGFVFDLGAAPTITVPAGSFVTGQTVTLTPSARTISGTIRDAGTFAGLPALAMQGQSNSGFVTITLVDGSGNYSMDATTDPWKMDLDGHGIARLGYIGFKMTESGSVSVPGINFDLPPATSLIYGSVKTPANVAVPFIDIEAQTNGSPDYKSSAISDATGNYTAGAVPTSWRLNSQSAGYLGQEENAVVNIAGSAVLQNLITHAITAHIRGEVRDNNNNLVPFLPLLARDPTNTGGGNEINSRADADASGQFDLGVYGGGGTTTQPWQLQINENDGPQSYISGDNTVYNVQDGVDINGVTFVVHVVTAHLRGQVLDENNAPIGNVGIFANGGTGGNFLSGTNTDGSGTFDIAVFGGTWNLGLSNIQGLGLIPQDFSTTVTDGADQNNLIFRARHSTATISGTVMNSSSMPIAGVTVSSTSTVSGANYLVTTTTDAGGAYSLPVFSATWSVGVNSNDLTSRGYNPVANQGVFVGTGTVTVNFVAGPLATAVSRKVHGGTPRDIPLPLTGNVGVECRSGGPNQIVVTFGQVVTFTNATLSAGTGSVGSTSGSGTASITVNLTGLSNAERRVLTLAGVNDGTNTFDLSVPMGVLLGDTTGNGTVNSSDIGQAKGNSGQATTGANFRTDVTVNGSINSSDIGTVKSASGTSLPP